jgi:hypothetical protein
MPPIVKPAPRSTINPMIDAAAIAICNVGHAQAGCPSCFDDPHGTGPTRIEPCDGCRAQASAAITAFLKRAAVVGMRHDGLDDRDLAHIGTVFEQADRAA